VHLAAYFGVEMVMKLLLELGTVDADLKDSYSRKPISWAAENRHKAIVRLLLKNCAER
jgi:ankyrin repeat protein